MQENYMVCNCKQVSFNDIANALEDHNDLDNVLDLFKEVQTVTHCSTGCGGCYDKVIGVISEIIHK